MKFMRRQVLANIALSPVFSHFPSADSTYLNVLLSICLRKLENLVTRIDKYLFICKKTDQSAWKFDYSHQEASTLQSANNNSHGINWAPLIKSNVHILNSTVSNRCLTGYSVLCVGGRAKLYPAYKQLIENSGGNLLTFHGNPNDSLEKLSRLLEKTDMIICPIDCVNHEAFLIVKYYCQCSGKLCILLDRSEINTFCTGIRVLSMLSSQQNPE